MWGSSCHPTDQRLCVLSPWFSQGCSPHRQTQSWIWNWPPRKKGKGAWRAAGRSFPHPRCKALSLPQRRLHKSGCVRKTQKLGRPLTSRPAASNRILQKSWGRVSPWLCSTGTIWGFKSFRSFPQRKILLTCTSEPCGPPLVLPSGSRSGDWPRGSLLRGKTESETGLGGSGAGDHL